MARGAPGNAGGGGTDGDAAGNTENAGGGGGGNGGSGGFGGNSWNVNLSSGGEGGSPFPATIDRIAMGGGGGAGSRNNSDSDNQASAGAAGGGIIFIRADSLTGTATLTANGANAYNGTSNDAGGGGGAGGSIVVLTANGGESGLTLQANGGRGGDAWDSQPYSLADRHGPGGGGGGGVIFVSGAPAGASVSWRSEWNDADSGRGLRGDWRRGRVDREQCQLVAGDGHPVFGAVLSGLDSEQEPRGKLHARRKRQLHDSGFECQPAGRNQRRRHDERHAAARGHSNERKRNGMGVLGVRTDGELRTTRLIGLPAAAIRRSQ